MAFAAWTLALADSSEALGEANRLGADQRNALNQREVCFDAGTTRATQNETRSREHNPVPCSRASALERATPGRKRIGPIGDSRIPTHPKLPPPLPRGPSVQFDSIPQLDLKP